MMMMMTRRIAIRGSSLIFGTLVGRKMELVAVTCCNWAGKCVRRLAG